MERKNVFHLRVYIMSRDNLKLELNWFSALFHFFHFFADFWLSKNTSPPVQEAQRCSRETPLALASFSPRATKWRGRSSCSWWNSTEGMKNMILPFILCVSNYILPYILAFQAACRSRQFRPGCVHLPVHPAGPAQPSNQPAGKGLTTKAQFGGTLQGIH